MERDLARGHELHDGRCLAGGDVLVRADHDARLRWRKPPALPRSIDVPLPLHTHVGVQDDVLAVGGERDQEMLAIRFDRFHGAANDLSPRRRWSHLRCDEIEARDDAAGEGATQHGRRAKDRVALGHPLGARDATQITARRPGETGRAQSVRDGRLVHGSAVH
jgi:hypothetical protein